MPNDYGARSARGRFAAAVLVVLAPGAPRADVLAAPSAPETAPLQEARAL